MRRFLHISFILLLVFSATTLFAQLTPNLSHYKLNKFLYNPASAGAEGFSSFNLTAKEQWIGFDQAPSTQAFSAQTRLLKRGYKIFNPFKAIFKKNGENSNKFKMYSSQKSGKVGLGAFLYHDQTGLINNTGLQLAYSYHIFIRGTQVSFGLGSTISQFRLNESQMIITQYDPFISENKNRIFIPDANVGIFLLNRSYYAGISANSLFESAIKIRNISDISYEEQRLYCLIAGGYIPVNKDLVFEPSFIFKTDNAFKSRADISITANYKNKYEGGFTYRTTGEMIVLTGIYLKEFFVGYAFDYPFNNIGRYSLGSHEISLSFNLGSSERRTRYLNRY